MSSRVALLICIAVCTAVGCADTTELSDGPSDGPGHTGGGSVRIDELDLATARVGQLFEQPISVHGGSAPYSWSTGDGTPAWLQIAVAGDGSARLVGTPEHSGTFAITVRVEAADGARGEVAGSLRVEPKRWAIYTGTEEALPPMVAPTSSQERPMLVELDPHAIDPLKPMPLSFSGFAQHLQWSSDGAWLVSVDAAGDLRLWDMGGLAPALVEVEGAAGLDSWRRIYPLPQAARFLVTTLVSGPCGYGGGCAAFYVLDAARPTGPRLTPIESVTDPDQVTLSPDGTAFIGIATDPATQHTDHFLGDLSDPARTRRLLAPSDGDYWRVDAPWSPDGRWVAFEGVDGLGQHVLFLIDVASVRAGEAPTPVRVQTTRYDASRPPSFLGWSPDGAWLLVRKFVEDEEPAPFDLQLVDVRGEGPGEPITLPHRFAAGDAGAIHTIRWSPDARSFALGVGLLIERVVFDVTRPQHGPLWQEAFQTNELLGWTATSALLFREDTTLFVDALTEGSEPEAIAFDIASPFKASPEYVLSPDARRLVYQTSAADGALRLLTFEPAVESTPIAFQSRRVWPWSPDTLRWLSDGSGLVAFTDRTDRASGDPYVCTYDCRFGYLPLSADGAPQPPQIASGQALPNPIVLQP